MCLMLGLCGAGGAVKTAAGRRPASSMRLGGALTRWSQIPIWDPSADDSDRYSFLNAERIPQGVRPGKDSGPSGLGLFGRREFLRCWLLALGRRGLVFSFQRAGKGAFSNQQSALSRQPDKGENTGGAPQRAGGAERRRIAVALDVGFVWRGGAVRVAAGRRPASSMRLGGAVTCPTCFRIHLEAHAHARPWAWHPADLPYLLNAERIPQGMRPGKDSGPSGYIWRRMPTQSRGHGTRRTCPTC